jgi:hypothetical protein
VKIRIELEALSRRDLKFYLNWFAKLQQYLIRTRRLPPLYKSGIVYARETTAGGIPGHPKTENWQTYPAMLKSGVADCEDLSSVLVGQLREAGEPANIRLTKKRNVWHVTVRRADGSVEDPSRKLGM